MHDNGFHADAEQQTAEVANENLSQAFQLLYIFPHPIQDMARASFLGLYTEGLHDVALPLMKIAEMPSDIREPFSRPESVLQLRLKRNNWPRTLVMPIDLLQARPDVFEHAVFKIVVTSNEAVASAVDLLCEQRDEPLLHVSSVPGEGRRLLEELTVEHVIAYVSAVIDYLQTKSGTMEFALLAAQLTNKSERQTIKPHDLPKVHHNLTAPNEIALRAFGWQLHAQDEIEETPGGTPAERTEQYVERVCRAADAVSKARRSLLTERTAYLCDYRYILALESHYWGHYEGFRKQISDAGDDIRPAIKLFFRSTVQATTYFDNCTTEDSAAAKLHSVFRRGEAQRTKDARSFTAGLAILSAATLAPVLQLEPKLAGIRGDLKQIGKCARSTGMQAQAWKLSQLARKLGEKMRTLVRQEFLDRIDADETGEIEGMKLVSDLPLELIRSKGLPLSLRFDVSRLPVLPGNLYLMNCVRKPAQLPLSAFYKVVVVRSFNNGDILHDVLRQSIHSALKMIGNPAQWDIRFVDIKTENELIAAMESFDGAIMVFDGHGTYESSSGAGKLIIGNQRVDIWELKGRIEFPPVVILSACDTQPLEAGHASAATAAFTLGSLAVLGTTLPIHGAHAGLFIARLLLQIHCTFADHIRKGHHVTWREVVASMTRMAYVTEIMELLHKNIGHIYSSRNYLKVQEVANTAILQRDANWHTLFVEQLAVQVGHATELVAQNVADWGGMTEALKYTHLGRPENIIIIPDDTHH